MEINKFIQEEINPQIQNLDYQTNKLDIDSSLSVLFIITLPLFIVIYPIGVFFDFWVFNESLFLAMLTCFIIVLMITERNNYSNSKNKVLQLKQTRNLLVAIDTRLELYDLKKEKLKLHRLKYWINGAIPELVELNKSLRTIYDTYGIYKRNDSNIEEVPTNEYIKFLHILDRIELLKAYYQDKMGGCIGSTIEETLLEIEEEIGYIDDKIESLEN